MTANPLHPEEQELLNLAVFGLDIDEYLDHRNQGYSRAWAIFWLANFLGAHGYDGQLHMDGPETLVLERNGVTLRLALDPTDIDEPAPFDSFVSHSYWSPDEELVHPAEHLLPPAPVWDGPGIEPF